MLILKMQKIGVVNVLLALGLKTYPDPKPEG